ncbi:MAG: hypothetical protein ACJAYF_000793 [Arenicella sp.]|jgi:hypothetical protein
MVNEKSIVQTGQRTIAFLAWGEQAINCVLRCLQKSTLPDYPIVLVTDFETPIDDIPKNVSVERVDLSFFSGKVRKSALLKVLPAGLETVLFLDVDTIVLDDISLGFDMAEKHGIAMAPAPHYSLADFRNFEQIMIKEGIQPRGQLLYNSGVIFFSLKHLKTREVFDLGLTLAEKYPDAPWGDQTYLTLAMEILGFNPYTLSPSFNHRAFGELISGNLRIWHSFSEPPANATGLAKGYLHRVENGEIVRALKVPL